MCIRDRAGEDPEADDDAEGSAAQPTSSKAANTQAAAPERICWIGFFMDEDSFE